MGRDIKKGDLVICSASDVIGKVIRFYKPTASEEQTMVLTNGGREYHAPTSTWTIYEKGMVGNRPGDIGFGLIYNEAHAIHQAIQNNVKQAFMGRSPHVAHSNVIK